MNIGMPISFHFLKFFKLKKIFFVCAMAFGILLPKPGTELVPSAVKEWNPNHWTTREFSHISF